MDLSYDIFRVVYEYEYTYKNIISEFSQASVALDEVHTDNQNLSAEGKELLDERQKFLTRYLKPGIDSIKNQITAIKTQAEDFSARIEKINQSPNSIKEFAELEKEPRVSFDFLTENFVNLVIAAQKRIDFFIMHKKFVAEIIRQWEIWSKDYESFETNLCEEFIQICHKDGIDKNIAKNWAADWKEKRFAIEERFLPLIEGTLKDFLSASSCIETLKILQSYKDDIDKFYLNERKNVHKKFSAVKKNELQERFETEIFIHRLNKNCQRKLQKVIFSCEKVDEKHFLLIWAKPLLNIPIDDILNFVQESNSEEVPTKILTEFEELKNRHFEPYLSDNQKYTQAVEKYEKDFESIMAELQKDYQQK